jgi:hypothetical protein
MTMGISFYNFIEKKLNKIRNHYKPTKPTNQKSLQTHKTKITTNPQNRNQKSLQTHKSKITTNPQNPQNRNQKSLQTHKTHKTEITTNPQNILHEK